jgi:hypothetical protein
MLSTVDLNFVHNSTDVQENFGRMISLLGDICVKNFTLSLVVLRGAHQSGHSKGTAHKHCKQTFLPKHY